MEAGTTAAAASPARSPEPAEPALAERRIGAAGDLEDFVVGRVEKAGVGAAHRPRHAGRGGQVGCGITVGSGGEPVILQRTRACPRGGSRVREQPGRGRGVGAGAGIPAEQGIDDRSERACRRRPRRVLRGHPGADDRTAADPVERAPTFHRGVQGCAQRPEVRGRGRDVAPDPLGGGKAGRADDHALLGEPEILGERRDAEVGEDRPAVPGDEHVAGLHVPVEYPRAVRRRQRAHQAGAEVGRLLRGKRPVLGDDAVERAGLDQLHDDPWGSVFLDHVEDGHHARMAQPGRRPGLTQRALVDDLGVGGARRRGNLHFLDRDVAVEKLIAAAPDDAHRPATNRILQPVAPGYQATRPHYCVHGRTLSTANIECPERKL